MRRTSGAAAGPGLPPATGAPGVREEIASSWRRVRLTGLDPAAPVDTDADAGVETVADVGSTLLRGAVPVLEDLEEGLRGSRYSTVLVDRDCRVARRWCDDPRLGEAFDSLDVRVGASLLEERIGTNALGTAMVARHGVAVHGSEHFVEALQAFSCYGHPIRHPLTKRIEGVLDLTALREQASPLLAPLVSRAVHEIEQRLLDGSRASEKSLLAAFQGAVGLRRRPILAVGEDIVLSNHAALDLLSPADVALLRVLADEPQQRDQQAIELTLESGQPVSVEVTRVSGARRGALLRVDKVSGALARAVTTRSRTRRDRVGPPRLVAGVSGSGRTTRARALAADHLPVQVMRPATALLEGAEEWAGQFEAAMRRGSGTVCVDGIDLLPDALLDVVTGWVDAPTRPDLVLTSGPVAGLHGAAATLAGMATRREELVPLAARRQDVPELAASMLREVAGGRPVHLTPRVVEALCAQAWPGNLRELKAVVVHLAQARSTGGLTVDDLPEQYRSGPPAGALTALEQAERDVIVTALRDAGGVKVRAAEALGLSRTTLYARMRALRING